MAFYEPDSEWAIEEIFSREGDELARSGFNHPDLSMAPDGFIANTTDQSSMLSAWDEAAKLGIDVEEYFEG